MDFLYKVFITHNRPWSCVETIYLVGIAVVVGGLVIWEIYAHRIRISQAAAMFLMALFLEIVFASTVLTRESGVRSYRMIPFWSWYKIVTEKDNALLLENMLNFILLMPAGVLLPFICDYKVQLGKGMLFGGLVSAVIEMSQLVLKRGLFEWDDIIHNSIGCMMGCLLANWIWKRFKKKSFINT